jgi:glycosyltransferase involved in cell wall biosynthesis
MGARRLLRAVQLTGSDGVPTFSVCIPVYNGAEYLGEAIESVLAQTFDDFELLICDDASTDATPELVAAFRDPRIRNLKFEQNLGQSGNFNRCIEHARGDLWTLLSADDRFLSDFLERASGALAQHPDAGFFVAAYDRIDEGGNHVGEKRAWPAERVVEPGGFLEELLQGSHFMTLGLVVRRTRLARVGPFRTDVRWGHDWDWVLRLVAQEGGIYSPVPVAEYREHDASGTAEALQAGTNGAAELRILREALRRGPVTVPRRVERHALRAFAIRQLYFAGVAIDSGSGSAGLKNLRYGVAASPWIVTRLTFWRLLGRALSRR